MFIIVSSSIILGSLIPLILTIFEVILIKKRINNKLYNKLFR